MHFQFLPAPSLSPDKSSPKGQLSTPQLCIGDYQGASAHREMWKCQHRWRLSHLHLTSKLPSASLLHSFNQILLEKKKCKQEGWGGSECSGTPDFSMCMWRGLGSWKKICLNILFGKAWFGFLHHCCLLKGRSCQEQALRATLMLYWWR